MAPRNLEMRHEKILIGPDDELGGDAEDNLDIRDFCADRESTNAPGVAHVGLDLDLDLDEPPLWPEVGDSRLPATAPLAAEGLFGSSLPPNVEPLHGPKRSQYGQLKRGRHLASRKKFRAAERLEQVPDVIEDHGPNVIGFSPHLLRSPIFGSGDDNWHAKHQNIAHGSKTTTMPCGRRDSLSYCGPPLNSDHGLVLFALLLLARRSEFTARIRFRPRKFAHEVLGWADSKHSVGRLAKTLRQLATARITRDWNEIRHERPLTIGLISSYWQEGADVYLVFDPKLAHALRGHLTFIQLPRLRRLSTNLSRWLYLFICASDCKEWLLLTHLRELYGTTQPLSVFGRQTRTALEQLKQQGLIQEFHTRRGAVGITKYRKPVGTDS